MIVWQTGETATSGRASRRAQQFLDEGGLPDYPEEIRETFPRITEEHGLDVRTFLGE